MVWSGQIEWHENVRKKNSSKLDDLICAFFFQSRTSTGQIAKIPHSLSVSIVAAEDSPM